MRLRSRLSPDSQNRASEKKRKFHSNRTYGPDKLEFFQKGSGTGQDIFFLFSSLFKEVEQASESVAES